MNVPCENSTPNTSSPVSVCVSKWTSPTGPCAPAQARIEGSVIEWSPPSTTGITPAASTWPTVASIAACEGTGRRARPADRPRREARARAVGDEVVHRRADDRDVEPLELGGILGVGRAGEREQ